MINKQKIKSVLVRLASPEEIRELSFGEVKNPSTISYKNQMPEEGGLFCQKIFGPVRDYNCMCEKYTQSKDRGKVCEICNVEVTRSIVRRSRFGHIELACPISHIWMLKAVPSKIASLLNIKAKSVEEIVYFVSYVVIEPGTTNFKKMTIIDQKHGRLHFLKELENIKIQINNKEILANISDDEKAFIDDSIEYYVDELKDIGYNYSFEEILQFICECTSARIETGAEAIQELLKDIDLEKEIVITKMKLQRKNNLNDKLVKRLAILEGFYQSKNCPEWMILNVIPVLPPDLRPIVMLGGDKHSASEINELYRRIIIRNERLKEIIQKNPAKTILNNEKRLLQDAVDSLLDNARRNKPSLGKDKRPLKSLSDSLKGKSGRFRQNLLGKRVDYSGRSVIVVGPKLKMYQCGLPRQMALELYKPFIISKILQDNDQDIYNPKMIESLIKTQDDLIWPYLSRVIKDRPVLLNRAPTLHRLGIQAFEVKLINGKAIQLPPLSTTAFNADFDGDQMAVHLPLSDKAISEARSLMLGSRNIIGLKDGKPISKLTQDMILGIYYMTQQNHFKKIHCFLDINDVKLAIYNNKVHLHDIILLKIERIKSKGFSDNESECYLITTCGKALFNDKLDKYQRYYNDINAKHIQKEDLIAFNKKNSHVATYVDSKEALEKYLKLLPIKGAFDNETLNTIFLEIYEKFGNNSGKFLDRLKELGFKYSTKSGITVSGFDVQFRTDIQEKDKIFKYKTTIIKNTEEKINQIQNLTKLGMLNKNDSYLATIKEWNRTKDNVQEFLIEHLKSKEISLNPMFKIAESGARGNISNFVQLSGMRGLMVSPKGNIIDIPIKSSFREGLSMIEFFISTHGARKGMADTALKTADSGYLTRRLVDVAQDLVIAEEDCNTNLQFKVREIRDIQTNALISSLKSRIVGRTCAEKIYDKDNNLILQENELITNTIADKIVNSKINAVKIRNVLICNSIKGVCSKCFGTDLSEHSLVKIGVPIGIIAAQSIGEPGTQLTMRTFHTGGVAGTKDITQGLPRIKELLDVVKPNGIIAQIAEMAGTIKKITPIGDGQKKLLILERSYSTKNKQNNVEIQEYIISYGETLRVKVGSKVKRGDKLTEGNIDIKHLLEVTDVYHVQKYILKEIQKVYVFQGIQISDKYIEIILKRMLNKVRVASAGNSNFLMGSYVDLQEFKKVNNELLKENKVPAFGASVILGLKKAPLESSSFLSAISFQDTIRVLTNAAICGRIDHLNGIKENALLGKIIPCGTGLISDEEIISMGNKAYAEEY